MVATLIINILSVPVNLQQISNWTTTFILRVWKVRHRTDGIWSWGPAGRHASGNRNRLKGARDCHRTQDDHHWAWGQTPAPHHPLCPLQSSASLLCPRQPAQVGSHCPGDTLEQRQHDSAPSRCGSSSIHPSSAVCSGMRMRRFWPNPHLFYIVPFKVLCTSDRSRSKRHCAPVFTGSANGEDLSIPLPSQWRDLQDSFFSTEFLSLSKESEAQGQTEAFWSWPVYTGHASCTTFFFHAVSPGNCILWNTSKLS